MAKVKSELEVSLVDRVSRESRALERNLDNLRAHNARVEQSFVRNRDIMLGTAAAAFVVANAVREPIQASIDYSTQLEDIRQMTSISQDEILAYGDSWRQVGLDTALGAGGITDAMLSLAASSAVTIEQADAIAEAAGRTATAYRAAPEDIAAAAGAIMNTLGVGEEEIARTFDILAVGAANGNVELKQMAGQFGILAASASTFGMEGNEAVADLVSMLEIVGKTSGTPDKAFTNFNAFLASVQSPSVRKAFQEMGGLNIVEEMNRAVEAGESPLEHALGLIDRVTEGGKRDLLGDLFGREEAINAIIPLLANLDQYRADRAEALAANGQVDKDFADRMQTPGAKQARFWASMEELQLTIGDSLVPGLTRFMDELTPVIDGLSGWIEANEELTGAMIQTAASLLGLRLATSAWGMASAWVGMNGGGPGGAPGKPGSSRAKSGIGNPARPGMNTGWMTPLVAWEVGNDMLRHQADVAENSAAPWLERRAANDAAINEALENIDLWGFKPGQMYKGAQDFLNPPGEGGIGGGYTGATQGQIDAVKAEIASLDAEIAEWPEQALEERRARLAEKLAQMEAELAGSSAAVTSQFGAMMDQLRVMAAAGVTIPLQLGPPSRMIDAPSLYPPSMPSRPGPAVQPAGDTVVHVGGVNVQNPTNANPQQIGRSVGQQVADRVRAAHSNGGMQ